MSEVTKELTKKEPVAQAGWLMFDHPCTIREARCLQQDGVLPSITLALMPTPLQAPKAENPLTPKRGFFHQDFEGLNIIFLNASWDTCKKRRLGVTVDWCTGRPVPNDGSSPRALPRADNTDSNIELQVSDFIYYKNTLKLSILQLDFYFSEALAEMRAAAGITAVEINANEPFGNS
ncbi:unnamed protein product [Diatraea saccharalis]|uniref:Uncharacterized protein n=1 Tax=Diatraea saccharalis TaxID=40085 RepID=A0A9N9W508_9NEOP|nr:unnamed protein product [Diatraea saccharalis]